MTVICHFGAQKIGLVENRFGVPIKVFSTYTPKKLTWSLKMMVSKRTIDFQRLIVRFHVKNFRGVNSVLQDLWSKQFLKFLHDFSNSCRKRSNFSCVVPPPLRNLLIFTCFFGVMKSRIELLLQLLRRLAPRLSVPQAHHLQQTRQPKNWHSQPPGAPNSREFTKTSLSFRCKMAPERKGQMTSAIKFTISLQSGSSSHIASYQLIGLPGSLKNSINSVGVETSSWKWLTVAHSLALHCKYTHIVC